jgi:hypothetical protein
MTTITKPMLAPMRRTPGLLLASVVSLVVILCIPSLGLSIAAAGISSWIVQLSDDEDDEGGIAPLDHDGAPATGHAGDLHAPRLTAAALERTLAPPVGVAVASETAPRAPPRT